MTVGDPNSFISDTPTPRRANPFGALDRSVAEQREQAHGTISARPSFGESMLPMAGQITGGLAGARFGGAPGMIAGATAGAVAGKGGQQALRARRGETFTPGKVTRELGGEALTTGVMESTLPLVGKALRPLTGPAKQWIGKKITRPAAEFVGEFFTGIHQKHTARLLSRGKRILRRELRSEERGTRLAEKFLSNADQALKKVNDEWASAVKPLVDDPASVVKGEKVLTALDYVSTEFIDDTPAIPGTRDVFEEVRNVVEGIGSFATEGVGTGTVAKSIPLRRALRARQQLDDLIETGAKQGLISSRQKAALTTLRTSLKESIHDAYPAIAKVDESRHAISKAFDVVEKFDPDSVNSVGKLAQMIDEFAKIKPVYREALERADVEIKKQTGRSLLPSIKDRAAAVAFSPTEVRAVRGWIVNAIFSGLGLAQLVSGNPFGAAATTLLGIGLSVPRSLGHIIIPGVIGAGRAARRTVARGAPAMGSEVARQTFLREEE